MHLLAPILSVAGQPDLCCLCSTGVYPERNRRRTVKVDANPGPDALKNLEAVIAVEAPTLAYLEDRMARHIALRLRAHKQQCAAHYQDRRTDRSC